MDKKLARALNLRLGKYANESTKNEKTVFGAKPIPAELKKKKRTDYVPRYSRHCSYTIGVTAQACKEAFQL